MRKKKILYMCLACILWGFVVFSPQNVHAAQVGNTSGNLIQGGTSAYYKGWIYYCTPQGLYKIKENGTRKSMVYKTEREGKAFSSINILNNKIFASYEAYGSTAFSNSYIISMDLNGKNLKYLADGNSMVMVNNWIYYTGISKKEYDEGGIPIYADNYGSGIFRMKLDGTKKKKISNIGKNDYVLSIVSDGKRLYCNFRNKIVVLKLNGKKTVTKKNIKLIGLSSSNIFYADTISGIIYKANCDFIKRKKICQCSAKLGFIGGNMDQKYIYYRDGNYLMRVKHNGKERKRISRYNGNGYGQYEIYQLHSSLLVCTTKDGFYYTINLLKKDGKKIRKVGSYAQI